MVSFKEVWSWNEFERFVVFSTIKLKDEMNFFVRKLLEVFYFSSVFNVVTGFWKGFLRSFSSKYVLPIKVYNKFTYSFIIGNRKT